MANMNLIGIVSSASKQVCHRGEQTVEYPPASSKVLSLGGQLGAGFTFTARLDIRAWVIYPAALSDSDTAAVKATLKLSCGTMDPLTKFIYITGDSIIYGTGGTHNRTISAALSEIAGKSVGIRNMGIAGHQLSGHYQDFKNYSLRHNYPGVPNIFVADYGHNDIKALIEAGSTPQQAVDTMVSQVKALCADLRTLANFNKIVWQECLPDARVSPDWTPAMESARDIWNATLRAGLLDTNGVNCFDAIDRVASDSTFILSDAETDAGRGMLLAANTDRLHPAEIYASARATHLFTTLSTLN